MHATPATNKSESIVTFHNRTHS